TAEAGPEQVGQDGWPGDRAEADGRRVQRLILVLGQVDLGRGDVALELADARRARYGYYRRVVGGPGQGGLGGRGAVRVRHLVQGRDQVAGPVQVLRQEQRAAGAEPVHRAVVPVVLAGEQPLGQRAVGDHDVAGRFGERQQVLLGRPVNEVVA